MLIKSASNLFRVAAASIRCKHHLFSTSYMVSQASQDQAANNPSFYIEERKDQGYAILKLNRPRVNSLSIEFLTNLNIQLEKFEQSKDINGIILTSNMPNVFSAGLDLTQLYANKPENIRQLWSAFQEFWIKLYGSNKIYIAALNGHSLAGGCVIALSCDYRIMSKGPYKIGLNETELGIKLPFFVRELMVNTVGNGRSEKALQLGLSYTPEQALDINLVDAVVAPEELMTKAEEQIKLWLKIPTVARELTKSSMRRDALNKLISQRASDLDSFVDFACKDYTQNILKNYFENIKNRNKTSNKSA